MGWAPIAAGVLAVVAVLLSRGWVRTFVHGFSEPAAIAFMFLALQRHLAGRHRQAFVMGTLVALARPEVLRLLASYGVLLLVLWRRSWLDWALVSVVLVAVPALWVLPDWISAGDPFHSSQAASRIWAREEHQLLTTLTIAAAPLFVASVAGALVALQRGNRALAGVVGFTFAWMGLLIAVRLAGYPASPRYVVVPEAVLCVAGASGALILIGAPRSTWVRLGLGAAAAASLWISFAPQVEVSEAVLRSGAVRAEAQAELATAIRHAGGTELRRCGTPRLPYGAGWTTGVVAWGLQVRTKAVRRVGLDPTGRVLVERLTAGSDPPSDAGTVRVRRQRRAAVLFLPIGDRPTCWVGPRRTRLQPLASFGRWAVCATGPTCQQGVTAGKRREIAEPGPG